MRWMIAAMVGLFAAHAALAQDSLIPERRIVVSRDVDFYGSDLTNIFDTSYEACRNACLNDSQCQAFTFNKRSNACFPKSAISDTQPYEGALSGEVFTADPRALRSAEARAAELDFIPRYQLTQAREQAETIGSLHAGGPWSLQDMLDAAQSRLSDGDTLNAMRWTGAAIGKADRSDLWLEYARLNRTLALEGGNDRSTHDTRAFRATLNAYLRSLNDPQRVSTLMTLSELLIADDAGRRALSALRLAAAIQPRDDVLAALDDAVAKWGFRIEEHEVENNLAEPRICAKFNEDLVKAGVDYATYVKLPDQRLAVQADDRRICIEGLAHGARYTVTFRKGLPAASGETLSRDTELTLYVRDRSPAVSFPGRAYVLPRTADAGLPIETVNLGEVQLTLQRVSDRNLLRSLQDGYFGRPLSYWQFETFGNEIAETVWTGTGAVGNELNTNMTTRLPLGEVVAALPTGLYALTADLPGADKYDETSTTQWFVLSDLGATTLSGADGLHVF
uniref:PAN/Apple domain-containing protein n=1 Tax=Shimia sp. TaxID=1954381 RepID=UPI003567637C